MPKVIAEKREMDLSEEEKSPTIGIDISDDWSNKVAGLRMYKSQRDAQEIASMFESMYQSDPFDNYGESREEISQLFELLKNHGYTNNPTEYFHQYYPKLANYDGKILSNRF
jgi:LmbE family N-acetylglucosaminyl deacetylase